MAYDLELGRPGCVGGNWMFACSIGGVTRGVYVARSHSDQPVHNAASPSVGRAAHGSWGV